MKIFNFIAPNSIPFPKLSAILYSLVLSVLFFACSPRINHSTIRINDITIKTEVTLTSSSAILNAVKGIEVDKITITKNPAGATGKWSISPKLPDGLVLTGDENADTATLEGAPKESSEKKKYTVTFTGSGDFGSASTTIDVQVAKAKVTLTSTLATLNAVKGIEVDKITITKNPDGATGKWSISPKLPAGLDLTGDENADTATLGGTPTEISEEKKYTVTFTGSGDFGSASMTIDVQVAKVWVTLTQSSAILNAVKDTKVETITITKKPDGATGRWSISPKLPAGLDLTGDENADTATLEGTPTETSEEKEYTVTFTGSGDFGSASTIIEVQVTDAPLTPVTLTKPAKLLATKGKDINPGTPIVKTTGATGVFSVVEKTLPAGLEIDGDTGAIKGTPKAVSSSQTYKIKFTGNDKYASAITTIEIEVRVLGVTLTQPTKLLATKGKDINTGTPIVKKPTEATGEFSATLPAGLTIAPDTGVITGNPTTKSASQTYPITFTGSGSYGNAKTYIDIEVTTLPTLSLSLDTPSPVTVVQNEELSTIIITLKRTPPGADVPGTWSIANASTLHNGLTFTGTTDSATATIAGTPDTIAASRSYKVTFTPTTLADYANVPTIEVSIEVVVLPVSIDEFSLNILASDGLPADTKITTTSVGATKGVFSGTLPGGLTLNGDGTITGTPTPSVTKDSGDGNTEDKYTVTFNGSDGFGDDSKEIVVLIYKYKPANKTALITAIEDEIKSTADGGQGVSADLNLIDTSAITDMEDLFNDTAGVGVNRRSFSGNISKWDVSKVKIMRSMFSQVGSFDSDISKWNVGEVTNMHSMFSEARDFNQDISSWNVEKVKDMNAMFSIADNFNQDISSWNVRAVRHMRNMFSYTEKFNQNLNDWKERLGNVETMSSMFGQSSVFNNGGVPMSWVIDTTKTDVNRMFTFAAAITADNLPCGITGATRTTC